jgi:hypothetical protein
MKSSSLISLCLIPPVATVAVTVPLSIVSEQKSNHFSHATAVEVYGPSRVTGIYGTADSVDYSTKTDIGTDVPNPQ